MSQAHRHGDQRSCGATTVVSGQSFVTIDGKLWAVENDQNTHGGGGLIASKSYITIAGKKIIVVNDSANPDNLCPTAGGQHCNPKASSGSSLVEVG
jgi:uncharacterized Zn-binding protein involved in type VI secretion